MTESITSLQNARIKNIVKLQEKSAERREQGLVVVEGLREINLAIAAGLALDSLFYCPELTSEAAVAAKGDSVFEITLPVFQKIAYREGSDGAIALFKPKSVWLSELKLSKNPLLIVLEAVEKPGNLGAVLRTADAAQADAVIICDPKTDIYNPNVIRSSVGCVFTTQVVSCTSEELKLWLKEQNITPYAAALPAKQLYHQADFTQPVAIVFGTEANGLTDKWLNKEIPQVKIPMSGKIDSLNVSNSVAIMVFEAMRQRDFK